eukprot:6156749-Amphidinium_carterae.1
MTNKCWPHRKIALPVRLSPVARRIWRCMYMPRVGSAAQSYHYCLKILTRDTRRAGFSCSLATQLAPREVQSALVTYILQTSAADF